MKYRIEMPQFEREGESKKESKQETQEQRDYFYANMEAAVNDLHNSLRQGTKDISVLREKSDALIRLEHNFDLQSPHDSDIWTRVRILNKLIALSDIYHDTDKGAFSSVDDFHVAGVLGGISGNGLRMLRDELKIINQKIIDKEYTPEHFALLKTALELRLYNGGVTDIINSVRFVERHREVFAKEMPRKNEESIRGQDLFGNFFDRKKFEAHLAEEFQVEARADMDQKQWSWCLNHLEFFLDQYGVNGEDVVSAWLDGGVVGENMKMVHMLEEVHPGSVAELYAQFGIRNFGRYPREVLHAQYEQKDAQIPYGVIMNPVNDHNRAFAQNKEQWRWLYNKLNDFGYGLRVVECKSKNEIARRLLQFDKKYGEEHKIDFAFIGGHGTQETIQFGDAGSHDRFILNIKDLGGSGVKKTKHFFSEHPTVMLNSCSTGGEREGGETDDDKEGIGQKLSRMLDGHVIAPAVPIAIQSINVMRDENGLNFDLIYSEKDARRDFVSGAVVAEDKVKHKHT